MVYFENGPNPVTFTKSLQKYRKHIFKCVLLLLIISLIMFTIASHVHDWFTVDLQCLSINVDNNMTMSTSSHVTFGTSVICFENITVICKITALLDIPGTIPMDETKKLLVLVIVFDTFALIMIASTTYCSNGVTKKAVVYIGLGCMAFTVVCATYGMDESLKHMDKKTANILQDVLGASGNCSMKDLGIGHSYRIAFAATIFLYVALLLYVIEWKFPEEVKVTATERLKSYRLMTLVSV